MGLIVFVTLRFETLFRSVSCCWYGC